MSDPRPRLMYDRYPQHGAPPTDPPSPPEARRRPGAGECLSGAPVTEQELPPAWGRGVDPRTPPSARGRPQRYPRAPWQGPPGACPAAVGAQLGTGCRWCSRRRPEGGGPGPVVAGPSTFPPTTVIPNSAPRSTDPPSPLRKPQHLEQGRGLRP